MAGEFRALSADGTPAAHSGKSTCKSQVQSRQGKPEVNKHPASIGNWFDWHLRTLLLQLWILAGCLEVS